MGLSARLRSVAAGRRLRHARTMTPGGPSRGFAAPIETTPAWGGPGVHGIARSRRWDALAVVETPGPAAADLVRFAVLPGGRVLLEEGPGDGLDPLVAAATAALAPPYRAEAVRREPCLWAIAANAIEVLELPADTPGSDLMLSVQDGQRVLRVDDLPAFQPLPAVEALGERCGTSYVVQASRLAGSAWEIRVEPL